MLCGASLSEVKISEEALAWLAMQVCCPCLLGPTHTLSKHHESPEGSASHDTSRNFYFNIHVHKIKFYLCVGLTATTGVQMPVEAGEGVGSSSTPHPS